MMAINKNSNLFSIDEVSKEKILQVLQPQLADELGDVIVQFLVLSLSHFEGSAQDLFEVCYPFFDGVVNETKALFLCQDLLIAFNKDVIPLPIEPTKLSAPVRLKDLFFKEPTVERKHQVDYLPSEYLFGRAQDRKRRGGRRDVNTTMRPSLRSDFVISPATFVVNRSSRSATHSRDLRIDAIDVSVPNCQLIRSALLELNFGRRYALVGRNGSGKSSLLRAISSGEIAIPKHFNLLHVEQEVTGDETSVLQAILSSDVERELLIEDERKILANLQKLNRELGQHHDESSDLVTTPKCKDDDMDRKPISKERKDQIEKELALLDERLNQVYIQMGEIDASGAINKAAKILHGLGFDPQMQQRATKTYSGGWRMRVALARALFCNPDILLLDEPTNMLDFRSTIWLETYLQQWRKTLLVISHSRQFLNSIATDIIHLYDYTLTYYTGNYDHFQRIRTERLKNQQRMHQAQEMQRSHIQSFVDRFRFNAKRASLVQSRLKRLEKMQPIAEVVEDPALCFTFPACSALRPPIIQFHNVAFGYDSNEVLFKDVTLNITQESRIAIVGANGMGKSTLLSLIAGDFEPTEGYIFRHNRLSLARFSQHHVDALDLSESALDFIARCFPGQDSQFYRSWLGKYGISGSLALQQLETLSGGQKSRVVFACMAMQAPHMMILDEPVNHLDIETVEVLTHALNNYNGGFVIISHDERLITYCCDEIWTVADQQVTQWNEDFDSYKATILKELTQI